MNRQLPDGWKEVRVADLARPDEQPVLTGPFGTNIGRDDFVREGCPVLTIGCLTETGINLDKAVYVRPQKAAELERYKLRAGDLLFSRMASVGRAAIVPPELEGALFNYHIMRLRLSDTSMLPQLFLQYVRGAPAVKKYLDDVNHGATRDGINTSQLLQMPVWLPPLSEQRQLIARLDSLQARSRRAREALDAVPPLLEKLRQSILAAAFRGDLTKDWRAKHPNVEPARVAIDRSPLPQGRQSGRAAAANLRPGKCAISIGDPGTPVPRGWCWTALGRVARMESGHTPSRSVEGYWGGDVPWVSIPDARDHNARVIHATTSRITEAGLANSAARLLPAGTVCLVRTAASIGYVTILGCEMATSQDFANWICGEAILPEYLMYALWAERNAIRSFGEGSAHPTVYFPELKAFHIKLAPLAEQRAIVDVIRQRLASLQRLRAGLEGLDQRYRQLEPSLLAKAFRGGLAARERDAIAVDPRATMPTSTNL